MILHLMSNITGKDILRYSFMPQVGPRLRGFFDGGFQNLAIFMALIYNAVKLIPDNHPYIQRGSKEKFGVQDVLVEASKNVNFSVKHLDQVVIYFALIAGLILLTLQFFILLMALMISPAAAEDLDSLMSQNFFTTAAPTEDLAFRLLDRVFGIPYLFDSKEPTETAFHTALHGLFQFYSVGLLVIGALIVIYYIFVVLAETAQTGTPFGKRYNHVWVPIRLVAAIGLLIPISYGLNAGQWITMYAAKFGSSFATNGWNQFYQTLQDENTLGSDSPVATPNLPELGDLYAFMMLAHACKYAYEEREIDAWIVNKSGTHDSRKLNDSIYTQAVQHSDKKNIKVVFGEKSDLYNKHPGSVYPFCGELTIIVTEPLPDTGGGRSYRTTPTITINKAYYDLVGEMWSSDFQNIRSAALYVVNTIKNNSDPNKIPPELSTNVQQAQEEFLRPKIMEAIEQAINEFRDGDEYLKYGWGGAGIFYNDVADINGRILNGVLNRPQLSSYPSVMNYVCEEVEQASDNTSPKNCYDPRLPDGQRVEFAQERDAQYAAIYSHIHNYWHEANSDLTGNGLVNIINVMFGTQGLFDMCKNANVHPLAQLSTLGKGLVETAVRNIGLGIGLGIGSIIPVIGPTAGAISSMAMTFAGIGILIGFILYYLLPFMPFLYFMFAVGGWVKGLFEAMVGVPLWALSHIRIDGEGLPGDGAINGYFLIFEIFLRPILIVFGLIAAVVTFGAMVKVLNSIFGIVITNLSGNDPTMGDACFSRPTEGASGPDQAIDQQRMEQYQQDAAENFRGPIDEFFYTIVYAILVYMIGMASFKMIDLVPNNILRWMGQGIESFGDQRGEPAEGLISKMAISGSLLSGYVQPAISSGAQGGSKLVQGFMEMAKQKE